MSSERRVTVRLYRTVAEHEADDRDFWKAIPPEDRVLETWRLSEELWRLKGEFNDEPGLSRLLRAFAEAEVRFLVVGAYALALHGRPRATGDLDLWVEATAENAARVLRALRAFGAPLQEVTEADFSRPGIVFQIGLPPRRIDLLTELTGLEFTEAWNERVRHRMGPCEVDFLGRKSLIKNKGATGRPQDLVDLESLQED